MEKYYSFQNNDINTKISMVLSKIVDDVVRHNTEAVAESVIELVCDDLRFKNKQNDPQYVMLNAKLREEKQKLRREKKAKKIAKKPELKKAKREEKHVKKGESKFNSKYRDRIKSIQDSDKIREEKKRRLKQEEKEKSEFLKQVKKETTKSKKNNKK